MLFLTQCSAASTCILKVNIINCVCILTICCESFLLEDFKVASFIITNIEHQYTKVSWWIGGIRMKVLNERELFGVGF